jgi:Tetratricopeptide repeat
VPCRACRGLRPGCGRIRRRAYGFRWWYGRRTRRPSSRLCAGKPNRRRSAYIDAHGLTIQDYLDLYRDPATARRLREEGLESDEYPESVARTWLLHFDQLQREHRAAVELLRLCAFLDLDDIDLTLLSAGRAEVGEILAGVLGSSLGRAEATGALVRTSLVTRVGEGHLRVHRLVQAVTCDQLDDDQAAEWARQSLNLIAAVRPADPPVDYRSWPVYATLAPHIEAVTGHVSSYPFLADNIDVLKDLGIYLSESGQFEAARTIRERVLYIAEAAYGPGHPQVAIALGNLAQVQVQLGDLGEARINLHVPWPLSRKPTVPITTRSPG